eukprot:scaffold30724_cov44-Attheya_sp.AAC.1
MSMLGRGTKYYRISILIPKHGLRDKQTQGDNHHSTLTRARRIANLLSSKSKLAIQNMTVP